MTRRTSTARPEQRRLYGGQTWTRYGFTRTDLRTIVRMKAEGHSFTQIGAQLSVLNKLRTMHERRDAAYTGYSEALRVLYPSAIPWSVQDSHGIAHGGMLTANERTVAALGPELVARLNDVVPPLPAPRTRAGAIRAAIISALTEYNRRMADINRGKQ